MSRSRHSCGWWLLVTRSCGKSAGRGPISLSWRPTDESASSALSWECGGARGRYQPRSVALLQPGGHRATKLTRLLVPLDGSPWGGAHWRWAWRAPLASPAPNCTCCKSRCRSPPTSKPSLALAQPASEALPWDEELLASAQEYVGRLTTRLQRAGLAADGRATLGRISETIVSTANEVGADLIVMSTHAWRGPARAVLGSVTDAVVRSARRPVLCAAARARQTIGRPAQTHMVPSWTGSWSDGKPRR